jgi:hypothetical protein
MGPSTRLLLRENYPVRFQYRVLFNPPLGRSDGSNRCLPFLWNHPFGLENKHTVRGGTVR